jgi:hypothetical protein
MMLECYLGSTAFLNFIICMILWNRRGREKVGKVENGNGGWI